MKKIKTHLKRSLMVLALLIVPGFQLMAAEAPATAPLPSSAYTLQLTDHSVDFYYGAFPIVLFSLMLTVFIYLIYRNWSNGTLRDDMSQTAHHQ